jgi:hypothetical protein
LKAVRASHEIRATRHRKDLWPIRFKPPQAKALPRAYEVLFLDIWEDKERYATGSDALCLSCVNVYHGF